MFTERVYNVNQARAGGVGAGKKDCIYKQPQSLKVVATREVVIFKHRVNTEQEEHPSVPTGWSRKARRGWPSTWRETSPHGALARPSGTQGLGSALSGGGYLRPAGASRGVGRTWARRARARPGVPGHGATQPRENGGRCPGKRGEQDKNANIELASNLAAIAPRLQKERDRRDGRGPSPQIRGTYPTTLLPLVFGKTPFVIYQFGLNSNYCCLQVFKSPTQKKKKNRKRNLFSSQAKPRVRRLSTQV